MLAGAKQLVEVEGLGRFLRARLRGKRCFCRRQSPCVITQQERLGLAWHVRFCCGCVILRLEFGARLSGSLVRAAFLLALFAQHAHRRASRPGAIFCISEVRDRVGKGHRVRTTHVDPYLLCFFSPILH